MKELYYGLPLYVWIPIAIGSMALIVATLVLLFGNNWFFRVIGTIKSLIPSRKPTWYHRSLELLDQETEIKRFPEHRRLLQNLSKTLFEINRRKRNLARPEWGNETDRANTQTNLDHKEKEKFDITMALSPPGTEFKNKRHTALKECLDNLIKEPELEACKALIAQYDAVYNEFVETVKQLRHDKPIDHEMPERLTKHLE